MNVFSKCAAVAAVGLFASAGAANAGVIFQDDFNRSSSNTVGNGWTERENGSSDVAVNSNALQLRDEASGGAPDAAAATAVIDASGLTNVTLSFDWTAINGNETNDYLYVSYAIVPAPSMSQETSWTQVFSGSDDNGGSFSESFVLAGLEGANFQLMFWTDVSRNNEGFMIDNVVVDGIVIDDPNAAAVPVPAALPLMGAGLVGLGLIARKRKSA